MTWSLIDSDVSFDHAMPMLIHVNFMQIDHFCICIKCGLFLTFPGRKVDFVRDQRVTLLTCKDEGTCTNRVVVALFIISIVNIKVLLTKIYSHLLVEWKVTVIDILCVVADVGWIFPSTKTIA